MEPTDRLTHEDMAQFDFIYDNMTETQRLSYADTSTMVNELYDERVPMIMEAIEKGAPPLALMVALSETLPEFPVEVFKQFTCQVLIEVATREIVSGAGL